MEYEICPYCRARIKKGELEEHVKSMHIKEFEMEMLNKIKEEQKRIMKEIKEKNPSGYIEFLEDLSREESKEIKLLCATEFLLMNEFGKAEKIFKELLKEPDANIYNGLGICYKKQGKKEKAIECFKEAIRYGENKISVINICDLYEEEGKFGEEEKLLNELIKRYEDGFLYATYARILIIVGKFSLAEKIARKAIELGEELEGYIQLSFSLIMQGKEKEAEKVLLNLNKKYPDELHPYILLANLYINDEPEKAEEYLKRLYERSREPFIMEFLITSYLKMGKDEEAEKIIEEALKLYDNIANFHFLKAILLIKKGKSGEEEFGKVIKILPSKDVYIQIADIYIDVGEYDKAMKYVKEAEKKFGDDEIIKCVIGDILFETGKTDEAFKQYRKSLEINENLDAYYGLIKCYYENNEYDKAEEIYKYIIKKYDDGWIWYHYANFLNEIGKINKSIEICKKALKLFNDEELLNEIKWLLEEIEAHAN